MSLAWPVASGLLSVNGTQLYREVRGSGPSLVFISGALGDCGEWETVANELSREFTVVTYDRRGNSRSPRPSGWASTTLDEQGDDLAALIAATGSAPAAVYGNSGGGAIALNLLIRHPEAVRGAILHEPFIPWILRDPTGLERRFRSVVETGIATGGMPGGVEAFIRFVAGNRNYETIPPDRRARLLGNGETCFLIEPPMYANNPPEARLVATLRPPVQIMTGLDGHPMFAEMARGLARLLKTPVATLAGAHTPQIDHPGDVASVVGGFFGHAHSWST